MYFSNIKILFCSWDVLGYIHALLQKSRKVAAD